MSQEAVRQRIRDFLRSRFGGRDVADDEDIFATGLANSLFAMQLVLFVESEFDFKVQSEDLEFANFSTVDSLVALVERRAVVVR